MPTLQEKKKRQEYIAKANQTEEKYGLPKNILVGLIGAESNFNPYAKSKAGALGLTQFLPSTAKEYNINPLNPSEAIEAAGKYLASSYKTFGNIEDALRSYNMGVGGLQKVKAGKKQLPKETAEYVGRVYKNAGIDYEEPSYANSVAPYLNQPTPTINYLQIPQQSPTFASAPTPEKEEDKETDVEVQKVEQESNFLREIEKEDYAHLQPQQKIQEEIPQTDYMQQYEQIGQFLGNEVAQQGKKFKLQDERNLVQKDNTPTFKKQDKIKVMSEAEKEARIQAEIKARQGEIRQYNPQTTFSRVKEISLNPLTAAGYAARNEDLPENFSKGARNPLDYAIDVINPVQYVEDTKNVLQGTARGDIGQVGEGLLGVVPMGLEAKNIYRGVKNIPMGINNLGNKLDDKLTDLFYGKKGVSNSMKVIDRVEIKNIDKLKKRYKDEFQSKYGNDYSDKDLELYVKLKKVEKGKLNDIDYNINEVEDFIDRNDISREYSSKDKLLADIYTKGYDSSLNRRVPEGITYNRGLYEDVIPQFEDLILKNKLKSEEILYRGNDDFLIKDVWRSGEKLENLKFSDLQKGDEYMPNSFYSTSVDKNVATRFGEIASKIEAPKGQSVFVPNATKSGNFPTELEVVLPEKLRYKVDEVYEPEKLYDSVKDISDGQQLGDYIKKGESLYYKYNDKPVPDNLVKSILDRINFDIAKNNKIKYKQSIVNPYVFVPPIAGASYLATQGQNKQQGGKQKFTENELAFLSEIAIKDNNGQWANPGKITEINSNQITMQGVDYPLLGISKETGETKKMYPNKEYKFSKNTQNVLEIPFFKK